MNRRCRYHNPFGSKLRFVRLTPNGTKTHRRLYLGRSSMVHRVNRVYENTVTRVLIRSNHWLFRGRKPY